MYWLIVFLRVRADRDAVKVSLIWRDKSVWWLRADRRHSPGGPGSGRNQDPALSLQAAYAHGIRFGKGEYGFVHVGAPTLRSHIIGSQCKDRIGRIDDRACNICLPDTGAANCKMAAVVVVVAPAVPVPVLVPVQALVPALVLVQAPAAPVVAVALFAPVDSSAGYRCSRTDTRAVAAAAPVA